MITPNILSPSPNPKIKNLKKFLPQRFLPIAQSREVIAPDPAAVGPHQIAPAVESQNPKLKSKSSRSKGFSPRFLIYVKRSCSQGISDRTLGNKHDKICPAPALSCNKNLSHGSPVIKPAINPI